MSKFKITVETKSRSKVVIEDEFDYSKEKLRNALHEAINSNTVTIKDYFFKSDNVNYIRVEEVE